MRASKNNAIIRNTTLFALVVAGVGAMTYGTLRFVKLDPFGKLGKASPESERLSFSLVHAQITHYRGEKLITRAMVDRIDVLKNQQNFQLIGIHDGVYRGEEGEVKFSGATAEWNSPRRRLDVTSGAHVMNADFDLKMPRFSFDAFKSRLDVPGEVDGTLKEGEIHAVGFAYNTKSKNWDVGKSTWKGPLALFDQENPQAKREVWDIRGDHTTHKNGIETTSNGYATNGETIVTAEKIARDPKTKVITATGNVFYFSTKANMTCNKAVIYTDEKRAVLTENVNMIVKPKNAQEKVKVEEIPPFRPMVPDAITETRPAAPPPGGEEDPVRSSDSARKYPASVLADKVEYWYKKGIRHAIVTGSPQAYQALPQGKWRRVWTHDAFYDAEAETLKMNSSAGAKNTRMRNSIGDDLVANWVLLSTKDENEDWEADGIVGKVYNDDQNQDNGPSKPPPGFERALIAPKMHRPTTELIPGGSGLSGPISGKSRSELVKPKIKPSKQHHK